MGQIDETLLYNGFNSYLLDNNETLWGDAFDVDLYTHISIQLVSIKLDGTATGKFIVRWIGEDKKKLGNDVEISFDVSNRWSRKTATLEVPLAAKRVMIAINGSYFHIACPMAEAGQIATAFDPSLASKMAWHDATGSYVGFLSANQIVAGILRSVTGDSGFDLELPRIWMKSNDGEVTWEATPENPILVKHNDVPIFHVSEGNLTMSGKIAANSGDIGGYKITENGLTKTLYKTFGPYTAADREHVRQIILGNEPLTQDELDKYDMLASGELNAVHFLIVSKMVSGEFPNPREAQFTVELNTSNIYEMVKVYSPTFGQQASIVSPSVVRAAQLSQVGAANGTYEIANITQIAVKDGIVTGIQ